LNPDPEGTAEEDTLLARITKGTGSGLCPHCAATACMWADICIRGEDPTPWAEYMSSGKMTPEIQVALARQGGESEVKAASAE
jgi:hypothetical protein